MQYHILLVNASDEKNLPKVQEIKNLGIYLTLLGNHIPDWIKPYVDHYIECDLKNPTATINILKDYYVEKPFHGAITFWDREVEITAAIADHFHLPSASLNAIKNAKNKLSMRNIIAEHRIPQAKFHCIRTLSDLENAASDLGYPFIFKPVGASASAGVFKIENHAQLQHYYDSVQSFDKPDFWLYPDLFIAEEYMEGEEVSVEGVVNDNEVFIAGITQKWKTENSFVEWQHVFPAQLTIETEENIIQYTKQCLAAIKLNNTAFHIELINHHGVIKMVEINARMGGDFITSYLLPLCGVNIAKAAIETSLGLKCTLEKPTCHACVRFLLTDNEGTVKDIQNIAPTNNHIKEFSFLKQVNDSVVLPPNKFADNRLCYVITSDNEFNHCIETAKDYLDNIKFIIE